MKKLMHYIFKSNYVNNDLRLLEVEINDNLYCFYVEDVYEIIDIDSKVITRETDDFKMIFDLENRIGKIVLKETNTQIDLELFDCVFNASNNIEVSFKYELDEVNEISLILEVEDDISNKI